MVGFADAAGRTYGPFEFRASQAGAVSDFTGSVTVGEETTVLTKIYAYYYGSGVTGVNADLRAGTLAFGLPPYRTETCRIIPRSGLRDGRVFRQGGDYGVYAAGRFRFPSLSGASRCERDGLAAGETVQSVTVGLTDIPSMTRYGGFRRHR